MAIDAQERKNRIGKRERIANDFLLQFAYNIAALILLFLIYNGRMFKYGSGIGLAISEEIVHLHDGTLDIESTPGEGTTVRINLPLKIGAMN